MHMTTMYLPGIPRANRHWTDEEWASRAIGEFEGRGRRRALWSAVGLGVVGFWLTVGLFCF